MCRGLKQRRYKSSLRRFAIKINTKDIWFHRDYKGALFKISHFIEDDQVQLCCVRTQSVLVCYTHNTFIWQSVRLEICAVPFGRFAGRTNESQSLHPRGNVLFFWRGRLCSTSVVPGECPEQLLLWTSTPICTSVSCNVSVMLGQWSLLRARSFRAREGWNNVDINLLYDA